MKYNKFETVRFKHLDGSVKTGKIVSREFAIDSYFIKVSEPFSYQNTVEAKGKILGYTSHNSQFIEYLVKNENIIEKVEENAAS